MSIFSDKEAIRNTFERAITVTLFALLIALLFISLTNDIYAFVKPEGEVLLTVSEPIPLGELSRLLQDEGIIRNPTVFSLFIKSKNRADALESFVGEAKLSRDMSYREIMLAFS